MHSPAESPVDATPRREQVYFADPAIDRTMGVVMALATEVYVLRDRLYAMERQLAESKVLDRERLSAEPTPAEQAAQQADREAFVAHILDSVLGIQAAKGATA